MTFHDHHYNAGLLAFFQQRRITMSNDTTCYVLVPVKVQISGGEVATVESPDAEDVKKSLAALGPIADKSKLFKLLGSYGSMIRGLLK
jgi:hypothetical protein